MSVPNILRNILRNKAEELSIRSAELPIRELSHQAAETPPPRGFQEALRRTLNRDQPAVIAEIKRASPSKGVLREAFHPAKLAQSYERAGATCLSVLTDRKFFQGEGVHLQKARSAVGLPLLCKDFIIDPYQVYEARKWGADCILLITAALGDAQLSELAGLAHHLAMDVLVETHDLTELERALALHTPLIGINNRNLQSFETKLATTTELLPHIPADRLVVTESGIHSAEDVALLEAQGVHAFLIGECFMTAFDPGQALKGLFPNLGHEP